MTFHPRATAEHLMRTPVGTCWSPGDALAIVKARNAAGIFDDAQCTLIAAWSWALRGSSAPQPDKTELAVATLALLSPMARAVALRRLSREVGAWE